MAGRVEWAREGIRSRRGRMLDRIRLSMAMTRRWTLEMMIERAQEDVTRRSSLDPHKARHCSTA